MDYGGRRLITDAITSRGVGVVLEIGSFLGGSARQWLAASPDVIVICVDHWPEIVGPKPWLDRHALGWAFRDQLRTADGIYHSFVSSMWDVRHRVIHVRGRAHDKVPELHALGLEPDMVYIDADKKGEEIAMCDSFFPHALIGGDDWNWSNGYSIPIRAPVAKSARARGRFVKHYGNTWLIDDRPWSIRERVFQCQAVPRSSVQVVQSFVKRLFGRTSTGAPRAKRRG